MEFLPENYDKNKARLAHNFAEALEIACKVSQNNLICITGSLYLVGEARKILKKEFEI